MWRDYPPGCAQGIIGGGFALIVIIIGIISILPQPEAATFQAGVGRTLEQYNFNSGLDGWRPLQADGLAAFGWDNENNNLKGSVRIDLGHVTTTQTQQYRNVVIEGELRALPTLTGTTVSMGVTCRADTAGNGYYFLISSTGAASIRLGDPNQPDDLVPLADWRRTDAITDTTQTHRLRVICANNYLALYVNNQFVADATDTTFSRGYIGVALAGGAKPDTTMSSRTQVQAAYDNISVFESTGISVR
jgi:hypothetical protein